ncbi:tetratricopeptide repeat protein [Micromonospora chokoriensis]
MLAAEGSEVGEGNGWLRSPKSKNGFLLVTSREGDPRRWASWCELQHLRRLDINSATEMLLDYSEGLGGDRSEAELLADRLGCLPLALKLAGSYLNDVAATPVPGAITTFSMYREALDAGNIGILDSQADSDESETMAARRIVSETWYLSIELLEKRGLSYSRSLTHLLSKFADAPIPYSLLLDPELLRMTPRFHAINPEKLVRHIRALTHVGLVDVTSPESVGKDPGEILAGLKSLHMHPLVRDVGRAASADEHEFSGLAAALLALAVEKAGEKSAGNPAHWPLWETLTPHVIDLALELLPADPPDPRLVTMIGSSAALVGRSLRVIGHLWLAECLLVVALRLVRSCSVDIHGHIMADLQRELAIVLIDQGRSGDAFEILDETRKEAEKAGAGILQLLGLRHEIAITLADDGRLDDAEKEFRDILKEALAAGAAPEHLDTMAVQFELAGVLIRKEEWEEAEELLQTVLKNSAAVAGERSELTISSYFKLGCLFRRKGDLQAASRHLDAALEGARLVYLPDSPLTLAIRHERALLLAATGNEKEASSELESVVSACRRTMGDDHPSTQASIEELGKLTKG